MAKIISMTRAPRGTKILAKAFFAAAEEIPEPQRDAVIKAAYAAIREELKAMREKAVLAKAKAKSKIAKAPAKQLPVVAKAPAKAAKNVVKASAKPARKPAAKRAERKMPEMPLETAA